jgi:leader peptidase (prepilin peptidase) / N-methyltransferase
VSGAGLIGGLVGPVLVVAGAMGGAAGWAARLLVGRLRRGARAPRPWCEAVVAAGWASVGAGWAAGVLPPAWVPVLLGLSWLGAAAGVVDVLHRRLPDALTLPALPVALLLLLPAGPGAVLRGAAGAGIAAAAHAVVHLLHRRALGAGDVKLAAPLGAVLAAVSWPALALAAVLAALLTAVAAAVGLVTGRLARGASLPHGPSMLLAAWLVTWWLVAAGVAGSGGWG